MTAREMFEKLGYTRNLDSKKIIYAKELKGMFRYVEITFNLTEKGLADKFASIPYDVDVLISHGPPYNFGQTDVITEKCVYADGSHLGSISLADAITRTRPKYVVFGHIHSGDHTPYERHIDNDKIIAVNVSRLDERYYPVYDIPIFDLP